MHPTTPLPDPDEARNAAEFIALVRQLRERSGLTYRDLEQRADHVGEVLPRSTLATALSRDALPRPELLRAFLIACGHEGLVEEWSAARDRLAAVSIDPEAGATDTGTPHPEPHPHPEPESRPMLRLVVLTAGSLAVAALAVGGHLAQAGTGTSDRADPVAGPSASPGPVEPGTYRIRVAGSELCLSESPHRDGGGAVEQYACPASIPVYLLEPAGGDQYTIRSLHPVMGHGCLGVDSGSTTDGARLMNDYCGRRGTAERFRILAAAEDGGRTFRIVPVHTGACVSVPGGNSTPGTSVVQLPCTGTQSGQLFAFDPVPAPTAIPDIRSN
ncbi:RICIN domain-containing protein [Streptomyces sp. NPDC048340]|uniref:RICIN domain-containing protein n=1 Tax=Streptomyces sp. NPDC048340 TaxID=3365537 RepID=UPI003719859C